MVHTDWDELLVSNDRTASIMPLRCSSTPKQYGQMENVHQMFTTFFEQGPEQAETSPTMQPSNVDFLSNRIGVEERHTGAVWSLFKS